MAIYKLGEDAPTIHESAFVADSATVIGQVVLAENTSVWFSAVLRGDNEPLTIGAGSNVQDGVVMHTDPGFALTIGTNVSIGHQAMLHGCTVHDNTLIGIQAVVMNGAVIGRHCLVGAGAVVTEGKTFADNSLILGAPARVVRQLDDDEIQALHRNARSYIERRQLFKENLVRIG
ncbi:gamma carbonic anhydrase family protein [Mycetohabitans sp. B5]|uniref:Carbonic anhydrase/acetyltransferase-like protein (Isoleucine patch superfamily) n=1 Tax=Mycetohabitans endofungorum TaxID=417203 RepID=A0A2P5KB77_9BURK|nr:MULTISPECIES: gamma carbonic anhydrase family protein [Burkholderiaceae]MCF2134092.1 gamma carbonic anhydrase family protein [Mycetohabitans sp. B3]MCG1039644.1 gamma carbonic anhydrase family protein [Mycetohabitans sp. B7]MCG1055095.1 gamma carbonic anhydrase family protein [Mycetohabitans sp. B5]PPB83969.1 carbonic anhydrase/acetyltransferase-like protein (isoleucine patch superfamily) [Mycetohabitans endofungorum]SIT70294.1 Carbonic anhydrase or acetyltransferase, isoleucine patch super